MESSHPPSSSTPSTLQDDLQYLSWLSLGHYIYAGLLCFGLLFGLFFVGLGMLAGTAGAQQDPDARVAGFVFVLIGAFLTLFGGAYALAIFVAGRNLKRRRNHTYCLVIGAIDCLWAPLGTILGIFTLVVLLRPSVKALFDQPPQPVPPVNAL